MTTQLGLFQLNIVDHHAVLGLSLAADPTQIRKRYLKVARKLHPDSLRDADKEHRQLASQLLSQRVNPAYEALSKYKSIGEHKILLKMKQQQLVESPNLVALDSDRAQKLLAQNLPSGHAIEAEYTAAIEQIASTQFDDLAQTDAVIGELSELNAAYLITTQKLKRAQSAPSASTLATTVTRTPVLEVSQNGVQPVNMQPHRASIVDSYIRRTKEFEAQHDYSRGILELREAIASHPNSAACQAYLSRLYLRVGQVTMAKIHAKQALALEPENRTAKTVQDALSAGKNLEDRKQTASRKGNASASNVQAKGVKKGEPGDGLLSGLFGGKKR